MQSEAAKTVLKLIADRTVRRDHPISREAALYHDLCIYGDDAYEILSGLHKQFGTNFSKFDFAAYFPQEGGILGLWRQRLFGKSRMPLTIGHLTAVVEHGEWFDPISPVSASSVLR
jgi:hypothetical protein